jgi:hypothetical protein
VDQPIVLLEALALGVPCAALDHDRCATWRER